MAASVRAGSGATPRRRRATPSRTTYSGWLATYAANASTLGGLACPGLAQRAPHAGGRPAPRHRVAGRRAGGDVRVATAVWCQPHLPARTTHPRVTRDQPADQLTIPAGPADQNGKRHNPPRVTGRPDPPLSPR